MHDRRKFSVEIKTSKLSLIPRLLRFKRLFSLHLLPFIQIVVFTKFEMASTSSLGLRNEGNDWLKVKAIKIARSISGGKPDENPSEKFKSYFSNKI